MTLRQPPPAGMTAGARPNGGPRRPPRPRPRRLRPRPTFARPPAPSRAPRSLLRPPAGEGETSRGQRTPLRRPEAAESGRRRDAGPCRPPGQRGGSGRPRQRRPATTPAPRSPHQVVPELLAAHVVHGLAAQRPRHGGPRWQGAPSPPASRAAATGVGDNPAAPPPALRQRPRHRPLRHQGAPGAYWPRRPRLPPPGRRRRGDGFGGRGKAGCRKAPRREEGGKLSRSATRRVAAG